VSKADLLGSATATLDEKPRKESQLAKAWKLIERKLYCGEVPAMEAAEKQGISQKMLNRAKTGLGLNRVHSELFEEQAPHLSSCSKLSA
jgi:hypothetical protein